jgi:L-alanine-DL-glutamate epimerase-like enolase superfamily enzyme
MVRVTCAIESWPIAGVFAISRGSRTEARVVTVAITDGTHTGRGECVPYARYGETVDGVAAAIESAAAELGARLTRHTLQQEMAAGAARNALDCALWDLAAKQDAKPVWQLAGLPEPQPAVTAYTISVAEPMVMEGKAREAADRPLLKVKLSGDGDGERIAAVRRGAPRSRLIVDANEAWTRDSLPRYLKACADAGVELIEQPLPERDDAALAHLTHADRHGIAICADESFHTSADLDRIAERYQAVNIKLDKTGGLTEAIKAKARAAELRLQIMIGCMLGTSLAMAPAMLLTPGAAYVDLDGPLLLAKDRVPGLDFTHSLVAPPRPELWG